MDYLYYLANASLTLRVIEHLRESDHLPVDFISVIHQIGGWVLRVKMTTPLSNQQQGDLRAFLNELGVPYQAAALVKMALWSLETGQPPMDVMQRYQIAVVSHGNPSRTEIEVFRQQFIEGLGYCPETLV
jgi:hypothetical protein